MTHIIDGSWQLTQSNGFVVEVDIAQARDGGSLSDGQFHGAARNVNDGQEANLAGHLEGDQFQFEVGWPNGSFGEYQGSYSPTGSLAGVTFDRANPTSQATWFQSTRPSTGGTFQGDVDQIPADG